MRRVLVANRGEIAVRILKACQSLDLQTVAVYSEADRGMPYLQLADRSVCIGPGPAGRSYLLADALLTTALGTGCDAIHPGYGFLSERADFAERCVAHGLTFVGPDARAIRLMGDKLQGRAFAARHGVPLVPGSHAALDADDNGAIEEALGALGFPLLIKASGGGGGRGMRVVREAGALRAGLQQARAEAAAAFGDPTVYVERYFERVHHVEVQVFGDRHGTLMHLGERDCSTQRRHQKLVEESPSPVLDDELREAMCADAVRLARAMGYESAGTVEFIFDPEQRRYYFIEMNTRIQVEHPVTEMIHGQDLVVEQLKVAAGEPLGLARRSPALRGHAIEWRINAEDPARGFMPAPGQVARFQPPVGDGVRVDTFLSSGLTLSPYYDSMIAKLIVHGRDRAEALARSVRALDDFVIEGVATTLPWLRWLARHPDLAAGRVHTRWVEQQSEQP